MWKIGVYSLGELVCLLGEQGDFPKGNGVFSEGEWLSSAVFPSGNEVKQQGDHQ
ncbi:MAG: hypothetical protein JNJ86_04290 [Chitinophagaceae bacterium]|nr:hypothetical protein [Chitinophagaceae bacterium]